MDFFHKKIDAVITPSTLNYFALYDPLLSKTEDDTIEQLLLFLTSKEDLTDNAKLRKIGLVEGIKQFTLSYDDSENNEELNLIELDNSTIISIVFEERYNFVLDVSLTKIEDDDVIEYQDSDTAPPEILRYLIKEGYDEFRLHNGTIESLFNSMEKEKFVGFLNKWWNVWFQNFQLRLKEDGLLKLFQSIRKSGLRVDSELKYTIDSIQQKHGFKEFLIINLDDKSFESNGLVYAYNKNLSEESRLRLMNWINTVNYYGLSTTNLLNSNIMKSRLNNEEPEDRNLQEYVYDPFKIAYSTLTDVSEVTGITHGINTGISTVASGINAVSSYMPWFRKTQEPSIKEETIKADNTTKNTEFLIGGNDNTIFYKNLYLSFEDTDEALNRIVIFKYFQFVFILIYDFKNNLLNEQEYYRFLFDDLKKIGKNHLNHLIQQQISSKHFYYIVHDQNMKTIETNLPPIPNVDTENDEEISDYQYFNDLSASAVQSRIVHKQIINSLKQGEDGFEKLTRSKNGWWIFNQLKGSKNIFILKKLKTSGSHENNKILESSTNIVDIIGSEAKQWLDNYIS